MMSGSAGWAGRAMHGMERAAQHTGEKIECDLLRSSGATWQRGLPVPASWHPRQARTRGVEAQRGGGRPVSHQVDPQQLHRDEALGQAQGGSQEDGGHLRGGGRDIGRAAEHAGGPKGVHGPQDPPERVRGGRRMRSRSQLVIPPRRCLRRSCSG